MKVVAFVPLKLNNQRTPGKNTKCFSDGTALISFFLKKMVKVKGIDELYCFCSDGNIQSYLEPGVKFLKRPVWLDTQDATPQDIISEFMKRIEADVYMVCHCTSPFVSLEHFEKCIEVVRSGMFDSAFTGEKMQHLFWSDDLKPINFSADNIPRTQDLSPIYSEISAAYVFTKDIFLKTHRRIGNNPYIVEVNGIEAIDIDYPEDFEIANAVYMNIVSKEKIL